MKQKGFSLILFLLIIAFVSLSTTGGILYFRSQTNSVTTNNSQLNPTSNSVTLNSTPSSTQSANTVSPATIYTDQHLSFSVNIPDGWLTKNKLPYGISFATSSSNSDHASLVVGILSDAKGKTLDTFLSDTKSFRSTDFKNDVNYKEYGTVKTQVNGLDGYIDDYSYTLAGKAIRVSSLLIIKNGKVYGVSAYADVSTWSKYQDIFKATQSSFRFLSDEIVNSDKNNVTSTGEEVLREVGDFPVFVPSVFIQKTTRDDCVPKMTAVAYCTKTDYQWETREKFITIYRWYTESQFKNNWGCEKSSFPIYQGENNSTSLKCSHDGKVFELYIGSKENEKTHFDLIVENPK